MDDNTDKKLDAFTGKFLKDFSSETPSLDFTKEVMSKIEAATNTTIFEYKPLISKKLWFVLAVLTIGVFSYLIFGDVQTENASTMSKKLAFLTEMNSFSLPKFQVSNILLYGIIGFTFFISIQMMVLKNHFDKRFA